MSNPKTPGKEPDPDSTDPSREPSAHPGDDVEPIADDGEPLGGNFA